MKKFLLAGALALTLAGCQSTGNIDDTIKRVQEQTRLVCSFVPTVTTVAKIIAALTGGLGTVDLIGTAAQGICDAVTDAAAG